MLPNVTGWMYKQDVVLKRYCPPGPIIYLGNYDLPCFRYFRDHLRLVLSLDKKPVPALLNPCLLGRACLQLQQSFNTHEILHLWWSFPSYTHNNFVLWVCNCTPSQHRLLLTYTFRCLCLLIFFLPDIEFPTVGILFQLFKKNVIIFNLVPFLTLVDNNPLNTLPIQRSDSWTNIWPDIGYNL